MKAEVSGGDAGPPRNPVAAATVFPVEYPVRPLSDIQGGRVDYTLTPLIGNTVLSAGQGVRVRAVELDGNGYEPLIRRRGEPVGVYLLHYGSYVKVGTSAPKNIVVRMFQQAPLVGVVVAVIQLGRDLHGEGIEKEVLKRVKARGKRGNVELGNTKPKTGDLASAWRKALKPETPEARLVETVRELRDPEAVFGELCEITWSVARNWGTPLYDYNFFWFTPKPPETPLPQALKSEPANRWEGFLKALPNGLFLLNTGQKTLKGSVSWHVSDYSFIRKWSLEVVDGG